VIYFIATPANRQCRESVHQHGRDNRYPPPIQPLASIRIIAPTWRDYAWTPRTQPPIRFVTIQASRTVDISRFERMTALGDLTIVSKGTSGPPVLRATRIRRCSRSDITTLGNMTLAADTSSSRPSGFRKTGLLGRPAVAAGPRASFVAAKPVLPEQESDAPATSITRALTRLSARPGRPFAWALPTSAISNPSVRVTSSIQTSSLPSPSLSRPARSPDQRQRRGCLRYVFNLQAVGVLEVIQPVVVFNPTRCHSSNTSMNPWWNARRSGHHPLQVQRRRLGR